MRALAKKPETPADPDAPAAQNNALFVCSDVHEYNDGFSEVFSYIVNEAGIVPGGAVFGGDFVYHIGGSAAQTEAQRAEVRDILRQLSPNTVGYYYQGNHDSRAAAGLNPTGVAAYNDGYVLYGINLDDVASAVGDLRAFLEGYYDNPDYRDKPLIVVSHCPLDETRRTDHAHGTAPQYISLLNEYGRAIDIVFLFGHSHTEEYENTFVPKGGTIDPENDVIGDSVTIQFTYMNMGFITNKDYAYSSGYSSAGQQHSSALKGPDYNPRKNEPGATAYELVSGNRTDSAYTTQDTVFFWDVTSGSVLTVEGNELKIDRYGYPADGTKENHPVIHLASYTVKLGDLPEKPDHEHDYEESVIAPGCTEGGYTLRKCRVCGKELRSGETAPLGHDWDGGAVTLEPTPVAFGVRTYTCRRCGVTRTGRIPPIGYMLPSDVDFTDPDSAGQYEIVGKTGAQQTADGLVLKTTRNAVEPCNGQNTGDQANTPEDLIRYELDGTVPWRATLEFDFDPSADNGYYQFFGFYVAQGGDYQNMAGIRGGDGALQNFLRVGGEVTADSSDLNSSPGLASAGTCWFSIEWIGGTSYICSRSADGESFTEMFRYEDTGIEPETLIIDAYTGMTEGYTFTLKSLTFAASEAGHLHEYRAAVTPPTCTDEGFTTYTCACGDSYVGDEVPALGHDYRTAVTAPTCTEPGFTAYTCARCGDSCTGDETEALGHDYKDGVCTRCGAADPDYAPPAPFRFDDVKDPAQYYFEPVYWAVDKGVTTGTSPTAFSPGAGCTRAQVVTFLWRAAGKPEPAKTDNPFSDVKPDAYYSKAVLWAVEQGITTGTSATAFRPDATCTRGQIVTFLWRFSGKPAPKTAVNPFADVQEGQYYCDAVLWAVEQGITKGTGDTRFSPDSTCTRAQIVTFLCRAQPKAE